jgi:hypothetical protein
MEGKKVQFRQGDVLVVMDPVAQIPDDAKEIVVQDQRGIILAYGEVTGHAHAVELETEEGGKLNARYWDAGAERFIQVLSRSTLKHEEHSAIVLEPGLYRQAFQTEDYGAERRPVAD